MGHITVVLKDPHDPNKNIEVEFDDEQSANLRAYATVFGYTIEQVLQRAIDEQLPKVIAEALANMTPEQRIDYERRRRGMPQPPAHCDCEYVADGTCRTCGRFETECQCDGA